MPEGITGQPQANQPLESGTTSVNPRPIPGQVGGNVGATEPRSGTPPPGGTEPAAAPAAPTGQEPKPPEQPAAPPTETAPQTEPEPKPPAESNDFEAFFNALFEEPKEPEAKAEPARPTLPYKDIGKMIGERTDENGNVLRNYQITTFDEEGKPSTRETGWMTLAEAADLGMRKWNSAELSFADQQRRMKATTPPPPAAEEPAAPPDDIFFGDEPMFGESPTGPGRAQAGDADLFDLTGAEPGGGQWPQTQPPAAQGAAPMQPLTLRQIAAAEAENAIRQQYTQKYTPMVQSRVMHENATFDEDNNRWVPNPGITQEHFDALVQDELEKGWEAFKRQDKARQQIQMQARTQLAQAQEFYSNLDATAEDTLGHAAPVLLKPMQEFYNRVVINGRAPKTPEEKFLAKDANYFNTRLLTALAMDGLKMRRELPKKLAEARKAERSTVLKEIKDKWANRGKDGKSPGAQVIDATTRANLPGTGGIRPPGAVASTGAGAMPPDPREQQRENWARFQDAVTPRRA